MVGEYDTQHKMSYLDNFHFSVTSQLKDPAARSQAPKLVFLHGVMGFSSNWRRVSKAFEDIYEVLVYDQRGHGRSFHPDHGYAPDDYAADLERILDELGWKKIHLVGHSMGGRVALHFASFSSARVEKLVLEDIGPVLQPGRAEFVSKVLDRIPTPFPSRVAAKEYFDHQFAKDFKDQRKAGDLAQFLYANIQETSSGHCVWRFNEQGIRESVAQGREDEHWDRFCRLPMPVLVIRGEESLDLPKPVFERMQMVNPHVKGVEIKGAGHWVHSEQPEEFIRVTREFLTSPHPLS